MKKILLIAAWLVSCIGAMAQTTVDTAIDLVMGENSYTFDAAASPNTAYFKYSAPENEGRLLTVVAADYNTSLMASTDGTSDTRIAGVSTSDYMGYTFPVEQGQTIYISAQTYGGTSVKFTASEQAASIGGGASCDDPVFAVDGEQFFTPNYYNSSNYSYDPTYISYTSAEEGVLMMTLGNYIMSITIQEGCDGEATTLSATRDNATGKYIAKYDVEANKTYIVAIKAYNPMLCTFTLTHPTEGSSCDMPFTASTTEPNVLPAAAGTYWYQLVPGTTGYAVLTSEASLTGGMVRAFNTCSDYSALVSVSGYLLMRAPVTGSQLLISIEKATATEADETFTLTMEDAQAGDSFSNPIELTLGDNTTPVYNGTYYYSITLPEGEAKKLVVDASEAGIQSSSTNVAIYDANNSYSSLAYGNTSASYSATAGSTYVVRWVLNENMNGFAFNVALNDIEQGEEITNPIPAVLGENDLAKADVRYYSYTATKNCWLTVDADAGIVVKFPQGSGRYYGYYDTQTIGTQTRINATAGTSYILMFSGMTEATTFTLSEVDFQAGEVKDMAIEITDATTSLPSGILDTWYTYTAPKEGKLKVSSDITYEVVYQPNYKTSSITVQINDGYSQGIISTDGSGNTVYSGSFNVQEGDKVYIHVVTVTAQEGKTLTCEVVDPEPGEASSNPLPLEEGEVTIPYVSGGQNSVWYSVELIKDDVLTVTANSSNWFQATLYNANDLNTSLASTQYKSDENYNTTYYLTYKHEAEEAATYLINVTNTYYGGANVTVTIEHAATDGISAIGADSAFDIDNGTLKGDNLSVYDLQGRKVFGGNAAQGVTLMRGIYIVNGKKIVVK